MTSVSFWFLCWLCDWEANDFLFWHNVYKLLYVSLSNDYTFVFASTLTSFLFLQFFTNLESSLSFIVLPNHRFLFFLAITLPEVVSSLSLFFGIYLVFWVLAFIDIFSMRIHSWHCRYQDSYSIVDIQDLRFGTIACNSKVVARSELKNMFYTFVRKNQGQSFNYYYKNSENHTKKMKNLFFRIYFSRKS